LGFARGASARVPLASQALPPSPRKSSCRQKRSLLVGPPHMCHISCHPFCLPMPHHGVAWTRLHLPMHPCRMACMPFRDGLVRLALVVGPATSRGQKFSARGASWALPTRPSGLLVGPRILALVGPPVVLLVGPPRGGALLVGPLTQPGGCSWAPPLTLAGCSWALLGLRKKKRFCAFCFCYNFGSKRKPNVRGRCPAYPAQGLSNERRFANFYDARGPSWALPAWPSGCSWAPFARGPPHPLWLAARGPPFDSAVGGRFLDPAAANQPPRVPYRYYEEGGSSRGPQVKTFGGAPPTAEPPWGALSGRVATTHPFERAGRWGHPPLLPSLRVYHRGLGPN
jgi:hypothetical protein